jgi:hypothetical protein
MSATTEKDKFIGTIDYELQSGVDADGNGGKLRLTGMMSEMLRRYTTSHNGNMPARYVVYREGVSDGEYATVGCCCFRNLRFVYLCRC